MFTKEEECDAAVSSIRGWANQHASIISADPPPAPAPAHLPWYRTVLRGSGFQLNASALPHPASKSRSRAAFPPTAAIPGIERRIWGSLSSLAELRRAALRRERKISTSAGSGNSLPSLARLFISSASVARAITAHAFFPKKPPHTLEKTHPSLRQHGL